jgi:hypothetical protein
MHLPPTQTVLAFPAHIPDWVDPSPLSDFPIRYVGAELHDDADAFMAGRAYTALLHHEAHCAHVADVTVTDTCIGQTEKQLIGTWMSLVLG